MGLFLFVDTPRNRVRRTKTRSQFQLVLQALLARLNQYVYVTVVVQNMFIITFLYFDVCSIFYDELQFLSYTVYSHIAIVS